MKAWLLGFLEPRVGLGLSVGSSNSWSNKLSRLAPHPRYNVVRRNIAMMANSAVQGEAGKATKGRRGGRRKKKGSQSAAFVQAMEMYDPVIGIEVHVQLLTQTKAFCSCSTKQPRSPNLNICPVCMGYPGALPVLNQRVVELAAKAGIALNCDIAHHSKFDRKNYYYADTSKNFQISQHLFPIAQNGALYLDSTGKRIGITRLHMEEDSAKMQHEGAVTGGRLTDSSHSLVDFNRCGVPLIEIVSEPDIASASEAVEYGQELQRVLRYIGASDCNMQDGSLRCDVNISLRPKGTDELGTKVELKNLNSFSAVHKSVDYEIERQAAVLNSGNSVIQETRTWDEKQSETRSMRVKEGSADYRYFPEPDVPPLSLENGRVSRWRDELPELPLQKRKRFQDVFGLSVADAFVLADDRSVAKFFDDAVAEGADPKQAANWIMGDIMKVLKFEKIDIKLSKLLPRGLFEIVKMIEEGVISGKIAKTLLPELIVKGGSPEAIVQERNLTLIRDPERLLKEALQIVRDHPNEFKAYQEGKTRLLGFFVGKTIAALDGRADPVACNDIVQELLQSEETLDVN